MGAGCFLLEFFFGNNLAVDIVDGGFCVADAEEFEVWVVERVSFCFGPVKFGNGGFLCFDIVAFVDHLSVNANPIAAVAGNNANMIVFGELLGDILLCVCHGVELFVKKNWVAEWAAARLAVVDS